MLSREDIEFEERVDDLSLQKIVRAKVVMRSEVRSTLHLLQDSVLLEDAIVEMMKENAVVDIFQKFYGDIRTDLDQMHNQMKSMVWKMRRFGVEAGRVDFNQLVMAFETLDEKLSGAQDNDEIEKLPDAKSGS